MTPETIPATIPAAPTPEPRTALDALALTLDPQSAAGFLEEHWDRQPLRVERAEPARFDDLLSPAAAEAMVCDGGLRSPAIRLVQDGGPLPLSDYADDIPWRPGSFTGMAAADRVAEAFAGGATIVLQALHLHRPAIARYCRALEAELGCPVQANAYWTPASAQGFDVHHDTHDVFVLQLAGRKRWRFWPPVVELPLKTQRWNGGGPPGEPAKDFVLEPGDTLYLPRGWPHVATGCETDSLHLTVGVHPESRLDAIRAALDECGDDLEFRRAVGADGEVPVELLERLAARLGAEAVRARSLRRLARRPRPNLEGQLTEARRAALLDVDDLVERRRGTVVAVDRDDAGVRLTFHGKEVRFPAHAAEAAEAAARAAGPFSAGHLPGRLDEAGRLVLVRRLVREGLLRGAA